MRSFQLHTITVSLLLLLAGAVRAAEPVPSAGESSLLERAARAERWREMAAAQASPPQWLWLPGGRLWFARTAPDGGRSWMEVDAASGTCRPAFDAAKVAAQLRLAGVAADSKRLKFQFLRAVDGTPRFLTGGKIFEFKDRLPVALPSNVGAALEKEWALPPDPSVHGSPANVHSPAQLLLLNRSGGPVTLWWLDFSGEAQFMKKCAAGEICAQSTYVEHAFEVRAASGAVLWRGVMPAGDALVRVDGTPMAPSAPEPAPSLRIQNDNLWRGNTTLTPDGVWRDGYTEPHLSPDGRFAVGLRVARVEPRRITLVESCPAGQLQPITHSIPYPKPGDPIDQARPWLFDLRTNRAVPVDGAPFANSWSVTFQGWTPKGDEALFLFNQRGHQHLRVLAVDMAGHVRAVVDEQSATFIDYSQKTLCQVLAKSNSLLWMSERDGWNHLWLYDLATGRVKTQVTHGNWAVRRVVKVDEEKGEVWFAATGIVPDQDPCQIHLARCRLDGSDLTVLTAGDGDHHWSFSPDGTCFIDTWSRMDLPPVHELRRAGDGSKVCELARESDAALRGAGWRPPERFTAKGRDGRTDMYGLIFRPSTWQPGQKLPVVEEVYPSPHDHYVPKSFGVFERPQALAELGFAVVMVDGMGTNWRSRAFHDVCWKNIQDAGLPDHIAWLKAAAAAHPELDLSKVGIYGGSAGGQAALSALLHHGDFYKAAVSDCGCHDNRMDKIWWNEAWMGWPVGPEYADNSNVTHAAKLRGDLLLTVAEMDRNVDPASTLQVVNALLKAGKDFEFLMVPGAGHFTLDRPEVRRRMYDFFLRKIKGRRLNP